MPLLHDFKDLLLVEIIHALHFFKQHLEGGLQFDQRVKLHNLNTSNE